jgi:glutamate-1-semialdehyde 2,1-aminomutase
MTRAAATAKQFASFFHGMLKRGIYMPPAPFEAWFISLAHSNARLDRTVSAFDDWAASHVAVDPA